MIKTRYFQGKLDGKTIKDFTSQLDYGIDSLEERTEKVYEVLNTQSLKDGTSTVDVFFEEYFDTENNKYFNVHPNTGDPTSCDDYVCQQLETMANYLLNSKENLEFNDYCDYPIETTNSKYKKEKQNNSLEGVQAKDGNALEKEMQKDKIKQYNVQTTYVIEDRDLEEIPQIRLLQNDINTFRNKLLMDKEIRQLIEKDENNMDIDDVDKYDIDDNPDNLPLLTTFETIKIRKLLSQLKQLQIDIKKMVRRPILFKNIMGGKPQYSFSDNTGYYNEQGEYIEVSFNKLDMANPKHIYELIKLYSDLKELAYGDFSSEMMYIIKELEELIDDTPLQPHEKDILIWKIDKYSEKEILKMLEEKHLKKFTRQRLSELFTIKIPQQIVDTYLEKRFDWHYTFKLKAKYKHCSKCGKVKVASNRYFSPKKKGLYGLQSICRKCR